MKPIFGIALVVGYLIGSWSVFAGPGTSVANIKITFATSNIPPSSNTLPREAFIPPGWDAKEHGPFTNIVAGRISTLKVTYVDPSLIETQIQIQSLLRELLSSTNTQTWTYHVWSFGDAEPNLIVTVDHAVGKRGKWLVWCSGSPGLYWAYQDGNGKWWWGQWDVLKSPRPKTLDPIKK